MHTVGTKYGYPSSRKPEAALSHTAIVERATSITDAHQRLLLAATGHVLQGSFGLWVDTNS